MGAAASGNAETVRVILERAPKTSVDQTNVHRATALHIAAQLNHADIIRLGWCRLTVSNPDYPELKARLVSEYSLDGT